MARFAALFVCTQLADAAEAKPWESADERQLGLKGYTIAQPLPQSELDKLDCTVGDEKLTGLRGANYLGCQSMTISGLTCMKWTDQTPHEHKWTPDKYPNLGDHSFCRNPFDQDTIWCMTTDPVTRWEYCEPYTCGNGKTEVIAGELCDDGNRKDGDGCSKKCQIEEGFICLVKEGEDQPRSYCKRCRNGIREGAEGCDDGNSDPYDGCDPYCDVEESWFCRNYKCEEPGDRDYPCPEGVKSGGSDCRPDVCGDGLMWASEECDDGNTIQADGCNHKCKIERGFTCEEDESGKSRCYNCGNDHIDYSEECDDGNSDDGDGCSSKCLLEPGAAYVDEKTGLDEFGKHPENFTCRYGVSKLGAGADDSGVPDSEADGNATSDNETATGGERRLRGPVERGLAELRAETRNTICSPVEAFHEKHQETFIMIGGGGVGGLVLIVFLGYEIKKWRKNKLRLKQGEILIVGKDGQVKKLNTFQAVLTLQIHFKRAVKKRRAAKAAQEKAQEQQDALRKQAQALQERKWKRQMMEASAKYDVGEGGTSDPL